MIRLWHFLHGKRHTMLRKAPGRTWFPTPEEIDLRDAHNESRKVREQIEATLAERRGQPHWLEDALTRYDPPKDPTKEGLAS